MKCSCPLACFPLVLDENARRKRKFSLASRLAVDCLMKKAKMRDRNYHKLMMPFSKVITKTVKKVTEIIGNCTLISAISQLNGFCE